jgi:hypothetical protein
MLMSCCLASSASMHRRAASDMISSEGNVSFP